MKSLSHILCASLAIAPCNWASELDPVIDFYSEISNIYAPSIEDLRKIQFGFSYTYRPIVERMEDTAFIPKSFKMIGNSPEEMPEHGCVFLNVPKEERENCIILYASFNRRYPQGLKRLIKTILKTDFRGHIHYRIGGWPNIANGDLVLAHVPFAFKVCFFREVQQMGYKRVLWLDASILPYANLNKIFQLIEKKGFFVQANSHNVGIFMNEEAAASFGTTVEETKSIKSCSAAILGIDFTNPKTAPLIDAWYQAAKDPFAFFSARSDQNALSILIYQMGLISEMFSDATLGEPHDTRSETLFIMDRPFVKSN